MGARFVKLEEAGDIGVTIPMIKEIPTAFDIPSTYRRTFMLFDGVGGYAEIVPCGTRLIRYTNTMDHQTPKTNSMTLDWIQESIEQIRYDVNADAQIELKRRGGQ